MANAHRIRPVREIDPVWIQLSDLTRLAAKIWLPEDAQAEPVPAILEYIPYRRRDATAVRDSLTHPFIAARGYACVRVDLRGSGDSDGVLTGEYLPLELSDGVEVIAWLARQPWCTGKVGMIGNSWGGFNGLQIAALQPPELAAIITSCSTDDRYADDVHFMGGALLNENLRWASTMLAHNSRPPDPAVVGDEWRSKWLERLDKSGLWVADWLEHQRRDWFWQQGSVCENYAAIRCPVFAVGGWSDAYSNAIPRLISNLSAPCKALIGQWGHRYPHMALPGPPYGFLHEALRWWDKWLKGIETGIMDEPKLRIYVMDSILPRQRYEMLPGSWIAEDAWPPQSVKPRRFVLNRGELSAGPPQEAQLSLCSPQTVGQAAGKWCPYGINSDFPADQRDDDGGSLVFDTEALEEPLTVLGAPVVELEVLSDRAQAFVCVRMSDVHPGGAATRITYGLLNLTHRDGHEEPQPLEPGCRYRVRVQLNDTAWRVAAGHRLRVSVSTTYWPFVWPSPEPVTLTLVAGQSRLELPVRTGNGADARLPPLPPHELPEAARVTTLAPGHLTEEFVRNRADGSLVSRYDNDSGLLRHDAIGLDMRTVVRERFTIEPSDPLSARGECSWAVTLARSDWQVETRSHTIMTATPTTFLIEAQLEAFENGVQMFARSWRRAIPRDNT
jgi:putative CocE/NonD family hydrolase